jgi:hypothetical protein
MQMLPSRTCQGDSKRIEGRNVSLYVCVSIVCWIYLLVLLLLSLFSITFKATIFLQTSHYSA